MTFSRLLLLACALPALAAQAPHFEGETLAGKHVTMPAAAQGHPALLIMGFSQASGKQTADWAKKTKALCETWSMAVLEDVPRLVRPLVSRGIRGGIPKSEYDHFLLVFKNEADLKTAVSFDRADDAYLLLLAPDGSVKWRTHGLVTDEALAELRKQLE